MEYTIITVTGDDMRDIAQLNQLAEDGWTVAEVVQANPGATNPRLVLARPGQGEDFAAIA